HAKVDNVIALSGDIHSNWAGELKKDFLHEKSPTLGVEFIGTSITTNRDGYDINEIFRQRSAKQPHVKFFNGQRRDVRHARPQANESSESCCPARERSLFVAW